MNWNLDEATIEDINCVWEPEEVMEPLLIKALELIKKNLNLSFTYVDHAEFWEAQTGRNIFTLEFRYKEPDGKPLKLQITSNNLNEYCNLDDMCSANKVSRIEDRVVLRIAWLVYDSYCWRHN